MVYLVHDVKQSTVCSATGKGGFMQDPILVDLLGYWERLRAGRVAPVRSDLDPREIKAALENTFILEMKAPGNLRFRLAGLKLCDLMGMDLRGMPARSLIAVDDRTRFDAVLDDMLAEPKIVELRLAHRDGAARSDARMLLLPMQNDHGEICRVLGCMVVTGAPVSPPQRFALKAVETTRIIAGEESHTVHPRPQVHAGLAESAAAFTRPHNAGRQGHSRRLSAEKPYLRLVRNDD
ncbi:MAG: PAS domain-containing protein [Pseudomonadota bacterium]